MNTHNIPFSNIKKKIKLIISKSEAKGFFLGTQERVRNSRGKRAISVRATEVVLYFAFYVFQLFIHLFVSIFIYCFWYFFLLCFTNDNDNNKNDNG